MLAATMNRLTDKQEAFAVALCDPNCKSAIEAYRNAGYTVSDPPTTGQRSAASALANRPDIVARVEAARAQVADKAMIAAADVLREWIVIATADPSELIRARRFCCRHCYGLDHRYQWISEEEWAIECARVLDANAVRGPRAMARPLPSFDGGIGYDRTREPVATCPHCGGDGKLDTFVADTHRLSPAGRKLFAGIKETREGIEVKFRDQDGALASLAKYLGMMPERHQHGGDPANPTPVPVVDASSMDAAAAAKLYAATMAAGK